MKKITPQQISPVIRGANYFNMTPFNFGPRINYAFQLLYVFCGSGKGCINENAFDLKPGLITIYGPGDVHKFKSYNHEATTITTICFSWEAIDTAHMATNNFNVTQLTEKYWRLADHKVSIVGLPPIPFVLELPAKERLGIETLLRSTSKSFWLSDDPLLHLKYKSTLLQVIYNLMKFHRDTSGHSEHHIICRFKKYIENNYSKELNRGSISRFLGISEGYLTTLLRKELNTNVTAYLTAIRMRNAIELLRYSSHSVKEIATIVGFRDYNYFIARFRQLHGKPPGAMR